LPFPLHAFQFVTLRDQLRPEFLEEAHRTPVLKAAIDGTVISVHPWEMIPLTARAQPKEDRIEDAPPIYGRATGGGGWIQPFQQRLDAFPQFIGHFPQRGHGTLAFGHGSLLVENL
jgi:hypothetical protein